MPDDGSSSSSSDSSDGSHSDRDWDDWGDEEGAEANTPANAEDEETATTSLFDNSSILPSAAAALAHDAKEHGFDLIEFRKKLSLDDYGTFRVVNFIRSEVAAGRDPKPALEQAREKKRGRGGDGDGEAAPWDDDAFLVPVNPEDPLLFYEYEEEQEEEELEADAAREGASGGETTSAPDLASLRRENEALRSALASLAAASLPPEAAAALPAPIVEALRGAGWGGEMGREAEEEDNPPAARGGGALLLKKKGSSGKEGAAASGPSPSSSSPPAATAQQMKEQEVDDAYFDSYGGLGIHREMLSDEARTGAYRRALEENPSLIKNATVLDVGAGTGVLSLFAARAGAAAVVAVEASARVAALARENALANGFKPFGAPNGSKENETTVTVVNARLEDIERLPGIRGGGKGGKGKEDEEEEQEEEEEEGRVDVLVSEWMGYALFFECMLDSVILARDRFLKKQGGAILPDRATVSIAGVSPLASDLHFWHSVHGLDLRACAREARRHRAKHGAVVSVEPRHLVTREARVHELDLLTCELGDEAFSTAFELEVLAEPSPSSSSSEEGGEGSLLGGIALWFDVEFSSRACKDRPVLLSTSPGAPQTHWHQALLELPSPMELMACSPPGEKKGEGGGGEEKKHRRVSTVRGRVSLSRGPCHRSVDVALEVQGFDSQGSAVHGTRHVGLYPFAMSD